MWFAALLTAAVLVLTYGPLALEVIEGGTTAFDRHVDLMVRLSGDPGSLLGLVSLPEMLRDLTSLGSTVVL